MNLTIRLGATVGAGSSVDIPCLLVGPNRPVIVANDNAGTFSFAIMGLEFAGTTVTPINNALAGPGETTGTIYTVPSEAYAVLRLVASNEGVGSSTFSVWIGEEPS